MFGSSCANGPVARDNTLLVRWPPDSAGRYTVRLAVVKKIPRVIDIVYELKRFIFVRRHDPYESGVCKLLISRGLASAVIRNRVPFFFFFYTTSASPRARAKVASLRCIWLLLGRLIKQQQ